MSVKIELDESKFGNLKEDTSKSLYKFYFINKDNEVEHITARHGDGTILIAVNRKQYKQWKNLKIFSERMR